MGYQAEQKKSPAARGAGKRTPFFSQATIQAKLAVNVPGDRYEQEADMVADQVMRMPAGPSMPGVAGISTLAVQRKCAACEKEEKQQEEGAIQRKCKNCEKEEKLQRKAESSGVQVNAGVETRLSQSKGGGHSLPSQTLDFMESRFGTDFSGVNIHTDSHAVQLSRELNAQAFTHGNDVYFNEGKFAPETAGGKRLLAHELTHVVQQQGAGKAAGLQREPEGNHDTEAEQSALTAPLTEREWLQVRAWQERGEVGIDPLTANPDENAALIADAIFCHRMLLSSRFNSRSEDPLLCVIHEVTIADPRVQQLVVHVAARGPIINWAAVSGDQRMLYVMRLLIDEYGLPENGAAGLVGNLWSESGVLPPRIEGSGIDTPMRARDFEGDVVDFTAEQVMNRDYTAQTGPRRPGIGLAQWTSANRRTNLFLHEFQGRILGADILFNMDAQVDYLVQELQDNYTGVYRSITTAGVTLNDASDEVVYRFEVPGSVLGGGGLLPREHPDVQQVFNRRRANGRRALRVYQDAQP